MNPEEIFHDRRTIHPSPVIPQNTPYDSPPPPSPQPQPQPSTIPTPSPHHLTKLKMPRTALFVIDIQHALLGNPSTQIPHATRIHTAATSILTHTRRLIAASRAANQTPDLEIVIVQHEEEPEKGVLQRGSEAWGLVFPPEGEGEYLVAKDVRECHIPALQILGNSVIDASR